MKSFRLTTLLIRLALLLVVSVSVAGVNAQTSDETPTPDATDEILATEEMSATEEPTPGDPFYTGNGSAQLAALPEELNPANDSGFVRFAHASPDTGAIDIYLDDMTEPLVTNLQMGEYTGAIRLRGGEHTFTARAAGSTIDSDVLTQFDWGLGSNSTWAIVAVGTQAEATFLLEPINIVRSFSQQIARVRVANVNPYQRGLGVNVEEGDTLAGELGWMGTTDVDLTVGTTPGTENGSMNITVLDANNNPISEPVSVPLRSYMHYLVLLTSTGDPSVVTPMIIPSTRDTTRIRFVNDRQDPIEVLIMPAEVVLLSRLDPGETSEYFILPSEAATFAAYAPGTGPDGQNLAGLPVQLEPGYDTTVTFLANGSTEVTEAIFTETME